MYDDFLSELRLNIEIPNILHNPNFWTPEVRIHTQLNTQKAGVSVK